MSLKNSLLTCLILANILSQFAEAQSSAIQTRSESVSLPSAIQTAFLKNEKTQANIQYESLQALKKSTLGPSLNVGISNSRNSNENPNSGSIDHSTSSSAYVSLSINIFKGFADQLAIRASECNFKHLEAIYNSTDTQIQNTKGQIAGLVANYYLAVGADRQAIEFLEKRKSYLERLLPYAKSKAQINRIENSMASLNTEMSERQSFLTMNQNHYADVVNEPVPDKLDSLEATISKIRIPKALDEALLIANQKSPELLSAKLGLECQKLSFQELKAQHKGLSVDLNISSSGSRYSSANQNPSKSTSNSIGITLSKSFDLGMAGREKASSLLIESEQKSLDSRVSTIRTGLTNEYIQLKSALNSSLEYSAGFIRIQSQVEEAIATMETQNQGDIVEVMDLTGSLIGQWWSMNQKKKEVIDLKFSIQRRIGILFDQVLELNSIPL